MYHIYTSPSLILSREPSGDSAYFRLLTRDFGLLIARAQGIRRDTARLKGVLQECSLATVAYVRTKGGWKITTAIAEENFLTDTSLEQKKVMARIVDTLIRFIPGEQNDTAIFTLTIAGFSALRKTETGEKENDSIRAIELLLLVRILSILGYIAPDPLITPLLVDPQDFGTEQIVAAVSARKTLVAVINHAFKESHL